MNGTVEGYIDTTHTRGGRVKEYTVWVGGAEINDHHLTKEEAEFWQGVYLARGYDDVQIEKVEQ